jgi:chromosome segregation ATPase
MAGRLRRGRGRRQHIPETTPEEDTFEWKEDDAELLTRADTKKLKFDKKIQQLEAELNTAKAEHKAQVREAANLNSLKERNLIKQSEYDSEMRQIHMKMSSLLDDIEYVEQRLSPLREEYEHYHEQQEIFMRNVMENEQVRLRRQLETVKKAIGRVSGEMTEIRRAAPPYTADDYKKLPEYGRLWKTKSYLETDRDTTERYIREADKERADTRAALEKWTKRK